MKAIKYARYGSPDVLQIVEIQKPTPKDDEVLIKICASSINSYDSRIKAGKPFLVRLRAGLFRPHKDIIPGCDVTGIIEAAGKDIRDFKVGDEIFGCLADGSGDSAYAEYVCAKESVLAPKPASISFEQAASLPMAAVTALQGLRMAGDIKPGQKILVNGASGGVGTFAVQIAKALGAEVTAVCSGRNADMLRAIGADFVLDYAKEDFVQSGKTYDAIMDVVANHSLADVRRALKPNGTCVEIGFSTFGHSLRTLLFGKRSAAKDGKSVVMLMANNSTREDLIFMSDLMQAGKITPVIDGVYPLEDIQKAFWYYEREHAKGKVVIKM